MIQIKKYLRFIKVIFLRFRNGFFCFYNLGYYKSSWIFHGLPRIYKFPSSKILIGDKFVACSHAKNNSIGVFQRVFIKTLCLDAQITIGDNVGLSGCTVSAMKSISIGSNVLIGSGALITDNDAHTINPEYRFDNSKVYCAPIIIEDLVFVGARAIILKGVKIGKGSVIGAGAVVTKDIAEYSIVVGNPAKIVGDVRYKL